MLQSLAGAFAAYALIWLIFVAAPVSRTIVMRELSRLPVDASPWLIGGTAAGTALVLVNVIALLMLGSRAFAGWTVPGLDGVALTLLYTGVVASTEEVILRGVMLTRLRRLLNDGGAILVTALVFSVMHTGRRDFSPASAAQYAADGVLLAWAALRTGSIWFGVGWHWAKNFGVALAFGLSRGIMPPVMRLEPVAARPDRYGDLLTYALALPLSIGIVLILARTRTVERTAPSAGPDPSPPPGDDDELHAR
jgi:membrane protease YdiL (CAAX protease family)